MATLAPSSHIETDGRGRAKLVGHRIEVAQLVAVMRANGWDVTELHANYAHLTLGQIHAALGYYYDHQVAIEAQLEADEVAVDAYFASQPEHPLVVRMREAGRL